MRYLITCLLAVITFSLSIAPTIAQQRGNRPPPTLVGDQIRQETASETTAIVGRFVSTRSGPIATRVAGAIDNVLVEVGDRVKAGQIIAELATDRLSAEVQRRKALLELTNARIKTAKASLKLAEQSLNRLERLRNSAAFSEALLADKQREVERAAAQVKEVEADNARALAELKLAQVDLDYSQVKAPYPGVVAERYVEIGGFVGLGAPIVTLIGDKALEIEAEAPTDRMGGVQPGATASVMLGAASSSIKVRAVLPRETGVSRTRTVRFGPLPAELEKLAIANAAVTIHIPVAAPESVVTIHKDAIIRRPAGAVAVFAKPDQEQEGLFKAEIKPVDLGSAVGRRFILKEGASPGDIAVIRGNETLRPNQAFKLASNKPTGISKR